MNPSTGFTIPSTLLIEPASPAVTAFLAILFIGGMLLAIALFSRRRQLSRLYAEAQYHYQALSGMLPTRNMADTASDYDAAAFRYNVVREFPLSRVVARSWPMLGWADQAFPAAAQGGPGAETQQHAQQPGPGEYVQLDEQAGGMPQMVVGMAPNQQYAIVQQPGAAPQYVAVPQYTAGGAVPQYAVAYIPEGAPIAHQPSAFTGMQLEEPSIQPLQAPSWSQAVAGRPVQILPTANGAGEVQTR